MRGLIYRSNRLVAQALILLIAACSGGGDDGGVTVPPPPATGSLTITVTGLPSGTNATVTVTGPSSFSRSLTATETLSSLAPGIYAITSANVTASDGRYAATPPLQNVTVTASTTPAAAAVTYALATGSLTVTVTGLPSGTSAAVTVTGPNQFTRAVTGTTTINSLEPGTYNITASDVTTTDDRYSVGVPNVQVVVTAGSSPSGSIFTYVLATGRLTVNIAGLPAAFGRTAAAAINGAVTVSGPDGFTRLITATTLLTMLKPGLYGLTAANVVHGNLTYGGTPVTSAVSVVASTTPATASLTYGAIDGALTIAVSGLSQGVNASITITGPNGFSQTPTATTTYPSLTPGAYTITAANVINLGTTFNPIPPSQVVNVPIGVVTTATVSYTAPVALTLNAVVSGLDRPVHLASPPSDTRLFVVEQTGKIRIISGAQLFGQPFLDVSAKLLPVTDPDDEHGLLGLVFHPQYATNGFFFIFYMDQAQDLVLERYQVSANPNVAGTTGTVVLRIPHTFKKSHNGGGLAFGPDGFLYISVGDGGCCFDPQGNAQNVNTLLGKVLRIDVNTLPYTIPASNPFVGQAGKRGEIWAYGLRNPWRFDIDVPTSTLYIADVGEDDFEEVDAVPLSLAGPNFGWNLAEGPQCLLAGCTGPGIRPPVVSFPHSEGCSITGGFVYRGQQIPEVQGQYFYSDYCTGFLRSFVLSNGTAVQQKDWNIQPPGFVTSFGRDASGELYLLVQSGTVYKIVRQ